MDTKPVIEAFQVLLRALRLSKPGDRSEADRWHQIVITDIEKAQWIFKFHAEEEDKKDGS